MRRCNLTSDLMLPCLSVLNVSIYATLGVLPHIDVENVHFVCEVGDVAFQSAIVLITSR